MLKGFIMVNDCLESVTVTIPEILEDEAFLALRRCEIARFNELAAEREEMDFSFTDLRGTDFRGADLSKVKLKGAYLRSADLRGQDLRHMDLQGCSIIGAKISGTFFPENISAEEIRLSIEQGIRIRTYVPQT